MRSFLPLLALFVSVALSAPVSCTKCEWAENILSTSKTGGSPDISGQGGESTAGTPNLSSLTNLANATTTGDESGSSSGGSAGESVGGDSGALRGSAGSGYGSRNGPGASTSGGPDAAGKEAIANMKEHFRAGKNDLKGSIGALAQGKGGVGATAGGPDEGGPRGNVRTSSEGGGNAFSSDGESSSSSGGISESGSPGTAGSPGENGAE